MLRRVTNIRFVWAFCILRSTIIGNWENFVQIRFLICCFVFCVFIFILLLTVWYLLDVNFKDVTRKWGWVGYQKNEFFLFFFTMSEGFLIISSTLEQYPLTHPYFGYVPFWVIALVFVSLPLMPLYNIIIYLAGAVVEEPIHSYETVELRTSKLES